MKDVLREIRELVRMFREDLFASASALNFRDLDLDAHDLGGTVSWSLHGDVDLVGLVRVDLAMSPWGSGRSLVGEVDAGTAARQRERCERCELQEKLPLVASDRS